jgi:hypothetical protein
MQAEEASRRWSTLQSPISPPFPDTDHPLPQPDTPTVSTHNPEVTTLPSEPESIIPRYLLSLQPADKDGNCLFHATSLLLKLLEWPEITHSDICQKITPWLLLNSDTYIPTANPIQLHHLATALTYDTDNTPNWEEYIQRMNQKGTYAEQPQLWAISTIYQVRIHIYSTGEYPTIVPISSSYKYTIYLQYEPDLQHYSSLVPPTSQDEQTQEHALQLPMEHLRHIIGFSSHVSAINNLQSQHLHHQQWIQHQLKQLTSFYQNHTIRATAIDHCEW